MGHDSGIRQNEPARFHERIVERRGGQLVDEAARLMLMHGCDAVRVEDVARACGIAKGTCYQHFGTKAEMLATAVRHVDEELAHRLFATASDAGAEASVLKAADHVSATLGYRVNPSGMAPPAISESWPCCLKFTECPAGGPTLSLAALRKAVTAGASTCAVPRTIAVDLLLAVPQAHLRNRAGGAAPSPRTVRFAVRETYRSLFPAAAKVRVSMARSATSRASKRRRPTT